MRVLTVLPALVMGLVLGAPLNAQACSLGDRQLTIQLDHGRAELGAQNARALAEWFVQWRDGLGIESLIVVAPVAQSQKQVANARLQNVSRILEGLNTGKAPISYEVELRSDAFPDARYLNSLDVSVQPACLRSGTCCWGSNAESR